MAGTIIGGKKAALKNKELYGEDFYKKLGVKGGSVRGKASGFGAGEAGRERARIWGKVGGTKSRRPAVTNNIGVPYGQ